MIQSVLVVDDDEQMLAAFKRSVGRDKSVFTATDPAMARQVATRVRPDLAVVDLRLGSESGIDLVRELKREFPHLVVALCSGYLSVVTAVDAVRAGADVILFKPTSFAEILRRLDKEASNDSHDPTAFEETPTLARAEWEHIMRVLADCEGNISMAARRLGIYRSSLQRRLRKYAPRE